MYCFSRRIYRGGDKIVSVYLKCVLIIFILNKIRDLFKVKLYKIRSETKKKRERGKKREREEKKRERGKKRERL